MCPGCAGIVERKPDGSVIIHHYSDPCDGKEHEPICKCSYDPEYCEVHR